MREPVTVVSLEFKSIKGKFDPATHEIEFSTTNRNEEPRIITLAKFFQKLHITKEDAIRAFDELP